MTVCVSVASVFEKSDETSQYVDELLFGDQAEVLDEENDFYRIKSDYGYVGYTKKTNLSPISVLPTHRIRTRFADLLREDRYYASPAMTLPYGARVCANVTDERFATVLAPDGKNYFIHKSQLASIKTVADRQSLVDTASEYLGVQYRWGGRTHLGIDCSGLCFNAYRFCGVDIWRDADITRSDTLREIPLEQAKMGDLLFFKGHVAMYLGEGNIIHSSASNGCVSIENFYKNEYLKQIFICVGTAFI